MSQVLWSARHSRCGVVKRDATEAFLAQDFGDTAYHCKHHQFDLNGVAIFVLSILPLEVDERVVLAGEGVDKQFADYPYFPSEILREQDFALPYSTLAADREPREGMQRSADAEMRPIWGNVGANNSTTREPSRFSDSVLA